VAAVKVAFTLAAFLAALVLLAWTPQWAFADHHAPATYQGKTAEWWAKRAVQARKDANARGRTIRRLEATLQRTLIPWYWFAIGRCESGLRWSYNGRSGFDGAVQFHPGTWSAYRLPSYPKFAYLASPFQQLVVAELVLARQGWRAWPHCSRKVGLR
jgi:hypothetical protein